MTQAQKQPEQEEMIRLRLVPVQVFGAGRCSVHSSDADGNNPTLCSECHEPVEGYGIMDAVSSWSDCNRAVGKIYRIDDSNPKYREEDETIEILVPKNKLGWFEKIWADD